MDMDKKDIRKIMREKRNNLSDEEKKTKSNKIADNVIHTSVYMECDNLCVYEAFRGEVSCEGITKQAYADGKKVYVPVTDEEHKEMQFYRITEDTEWREGAYGIKEPVVDLETERLDSKALILMPGLAFDREHHRLGYGGGYYDKFLATHEDCVTMALGYDFQLVDEILPHEEHDILPDYIVTEERISNKTQRLKIY